MGDRSQVQFENKVTGEKSCIVYSQWGDPYMFNEAVRYAVKISKQETEMTPIDRLEVDAVLAGYLQYVMRDAIGAPVSRIFEPDDRYFNEKHLKVCLPLVNDDDLLLTHGAASRSVSIESPCFALAWRNE